MASVALLGTRLAVQVLLRDEEGGYPDADYDYLSWMNTAESGEGLPEVRDKRRIPRSQDCRTCSGLDV